MSRISTTGTVGSGDRRSMMPEEVGDGVWVQEVQTPITPSRTSIYSRFSVDASSLSVQHSRSSAYVEEEVLVIDDSIPSGNTRIGFAAPPEKHQVDDVVYIERQNVPPTSASTSKTLTPNTFSPSEQTTQHFQPGPDFILEPDSPATLNTPSSMPEERDPPLRTISLAVNHKRRDPRVSPDRAAHDRRQQDWKGPQEDFGPRSDSLPRNSRSRSRSRPAPFLPAVKSAETLASSPVVHSAPNLASQSVPNLATVSQTSARKEAFANVLRNPRLYGMLKAFVAGEHCSENISFLEQLSAAEMMTGANGELPNQDTPLDGSRVLGRFLGTGENEPTSYANFEKLSHLYTSFIREGAPLEINVPDPVRRDARGWLSANQTLKFPAPPVAFDAAADEVISMLYRDVFPRFQAKAASTPTKETPGADADDQGENRGRSSGERGRRQRAGSLGGAKAANEERKTRERSKSQGRFAWLRFKE
ncbi:hypothetical protein HDU96_006764 [Phlyctochytrium bullatum]|nr:hypothetical protein HDU96_006764 [Phlyctochytrium bullatum]